MLFKKKSLLVAFISSAVVALVLVLTLMSYVLYIEIKGEEDRVLYEDALKKIPHN